MKTDDKIKLAVELAKELLRAGDSNTNAADRAVFCVQRISEALIAAEPVVLPVAERK